MRGRRRLALLLLAPLTTAQGPPPPPLPPAAATGVWAELAALSPGDLGRRMLGAAGADTVEAIVDQPTKLVVLAETPRNAGYYGLCAAQVAYLKVDDAGEASIFRITQAFHAVGDVEQREGWSEDYARKLDVQCAPVRPIIDFAAPTRGAFHSVNLMGDRTGGAWASFGARAVRQGKRDAAKLRVRCTEDPYNPPRSCDDPKATLAALDPALLLAIDVAPCADAAAMFCVKAEFSRRPVADDPRRLAVTFRTDRPVAEGWGDRFAVTAATMKAETIVR